MARDGTGDDARRGDVSRAVRRAVAFKVLRDVSRESAEIVRAHRARARVALVLLAVVLLVAGACAVVAAFVYGRL